MLFLILLIINIIESKHVAIIKYHDVIIFTKNNSSRIFKNRIGGFIFVYGDFKSKRSETFHNQKILSKHLTLRTYCNRDFSLKNKYYFLDISPSTVARFAFITLKHIICFHNYLPSLLKVILNPASPTRNNLAYILIFINHPITFHTIKLHSVRHRMDML